MSTARAVLLDNDGRNMVEVSAMGGMVELKAFSLSSSSSIVHDMTPDAAMSLAAALLRAARAASR